MSKKTICITGHKGILATNFIKKFNKNFKFYYYPKRIENLNNFKNWASKKKFNFLIHNAAVFKGKNIIKVNKTSSINLIKYLDKYKKTDYFLFVSSAHVYGFSKKKFYENSKRKPKSRYGLSKKLVEDFISKNSNKFNFKIGVARIFNFTHHLQKEGHFVPDIIKKIKKQKKIVNINCYRDFIDIDDVCIAINKMLKSNYNGPMNICSGKRINLVNITEYMSKKINKTAIIDKKRALDLFGDNSKLKALGVNKFKSVKKILKKFN